MKWTIMIFLFIHKYVENKIFFFEMLIWITWQMLMQINLTGFMCRMTYKIYNYQTNTYFL